MAITIEQLREEVRDNLKLEGVREVPSGPTRVIRALNRAKDHLVAMLELVDPGLFIARKDYSVTQGGTNITLPDGTTAGEPRSRRGFGDFSKVDSDGTESQIGVYSLNDPASRESDTGYWLYREGNKLYFSEQTGAPESFTLRLRYSAAVPDLDTSDLSVSYSLIPEEWTDMLVIRATRDLLPADNPGRAKWNEEYQARANALTASGQHRIRTEPMRIKRSDDWDA